MNHIPAGMILNFEYVKKHKVKCEVCKREAYATFHDKEWNDHEYCKEHYPMGGRFVEESDKG